MRAPVEQVVQTATRVLEGTLTAREAVTILATLADHAVPAARDLRRAEPERADAYRELVLAVGRELRRREEDGDADARYLRAVTDDLARVLGALG